MPPLSPVMVSFLFIWVIWEKAPENVEQKVAISGVGDRSKTAVSQILYPIVNLILFRHLKGMFLLAPKYIGNVKAKVYSHVRVVLITLLTRC